MRRNAMSTLALAALLLSGRAFAAGALDAEMSPMKAVVEQVDATAQVAASADASPFEVRNAGAQLQAKVENAAAPVFVAHPWAHESRTPAQDMTAKGMVELGRQVLLDAQTVPDPAIAQSFDQVAALDAAGRAEQSASMSQKVMGYFHYSTQDPTGTISFNTLLDQIGQRFPQMRFILASVAAHEGTHAVDSQIAAEDTEASELKAFKVQRAYLEALYPTGYELTTLRMALDFLYKKSPDGLTKIAKDIAATCDAIWGAKTDDALKQVIKKLYPNGEPNVSSA